MLKSSILGFHSRDSMLDYGCYLLSLCPSNVKKSKTRVREFEMVLCMVVGCGRKSCKHKVDFSKIPKIITNQGEVWEELMRERRNSWISAVSQGDTDEKNILESMFVVVISFQGRLQLGQAQYRLGSNFKPR